MTDHRRHPRDLHLLRAPVAVTVLAGLDRDATAMTAAGLLTRTDRCASVYVDPSTADQGFVNWWVSDSDGRHVAGRLAVVADCPACALREAYLGRLVDLGGSGRYDTVLVELHPGVEPDAAVAALCAGLPSELARIDTVVCVLDTETWLDDLAGDTDLLDRGIAVDADDHRSVGAVLGAQLDVADRVVLLTPGTALRPVPVEQAAALRALAPDARRIAPATVLDIPPRQVLHTGAHDPRCLHPLAERGLLDWTRPPTASGSLRVVRWERRDRPLHPQRLHDALDHLADGVIRSSGHLWVAHAADTVVRWDSCGDCLQLGAAAHFANAGASTGNRLAFLGDDLDRTAVTAVLDGCVLTDAEMDQPPSVWTDLDHSLPDWQFSAPDPDEETP